MTDYENRSARTPRQKLISRGAAKKDRPSSEHVAAEPDATMQTSHSLSKPPLLSGSSRVINASDLLGSFLEVGIIHSGHRYRLRITSANKLILTK